MSLKPPKKSDLGKSWMKDRRDKARMIQPEYHLIASEISFIFFLHRYRSECSHRTAACLRYG